MQKTHDSRNGGRGGREGMRKKERNIVTRRERLHWRRGSGGKCESRIAGKGARRKGKEDFLKRIFYMEAASVLVGGRRGVKVRCVRDFQCRASN